MKKIAIALGVIIIVLVGYILLTPKKIITKIIEVSSKEGERIIYKPVEVVKWDTVYKNKVIQSVTKVKNPINVDLLKKYNEAKQANDSLKLDRLYREAITERTYKELLSDSTVDITVHSFVTGKLTYQKIEYKTKPQKIIIPAEKQRLKVYLGGYTNIGIEDYSTSSVGASLNVINKNQNKIYTFGYDTKGNATIGISFKIF